MNSSLTRSALLLALTLPCAAPAAAQDELVPTQELERIARVMVGRLEHSHYKEVELDDEMSAGLFERYLEALDPARCLFTQKDLERFEPLRTRLDEALDRGDLRPAYTIFRAFQARRTQRLEFLLAAVDAGLGIVDLNDDEWLEIDRSAAPRPLDERDLREVWRRQLENDVLTLHLNDTEPDEVEQRLAKRYQRQLERASRLETEDVFAVFAGAVTGAWDPHTVFFPPRAAEDFDIQMSLSLEGIGGLLGSDGDLVRIERLIPGGPAMRSGELQATDRIVSVAQGEDGAPVEIVGWTTTEAVELIRGPKGSLVRLGILPANVPLGTRPREVRIVRDKVKLEDQAASGELLEFDSEGETYKVGLVRLPDFYMDFRAYGRGDPNYKSSSRDVARLVKDLESQGAQAMLVDLRGNGGGSLVEATALTGLFVGKKPVVQVRYSDGGVQVLPSKVDAIWDGPLCVLVDRLSASASEIFAGAIQDHGRGLVLGQRTFGKGTVQQIAPLGKDGGELKLTQAMFFRVSGASTQHKGVEPDIAFPALWDESLIGESSLDGSLPWEGIRGLGDERSAAYRATLSSILPKLEEAHEKRASEDPGLVHARRLAGLASDLRARERVSLNENQRRAEIASDEARRLEIENGRLRAEGKEELSDVDSIEPRRNNDGSTPEADASAREAARITVDLIRTLKRRTA